MLRMVCIALALASLSACACVGPRPAVLNSFSITRFDEPGADVAPMQNAAALAVLTLHRQRFDLPSQREPDMRMIYATAYDRKYRIVGRRRQRVVRART